MMTSAPLAPAPSDPPEPFTDQLRLADLLHPPNVELEVRPPGGQRVEAMISTPEMNIPSSQEWTDTGVTARPGAAVGISAIGEVYLAAARSTHAPGGDSSCTPAASYAASSTLFPAPQPPCWSLIARFGNGTPFEVGTSIVVTATSGQLYLGVNSDSFSGNAGIWTVKIKIGGQP